MNTKLSSVTREIVIEAARDAATKGQGILSRSDFQRITGISQYHIYRLFPEGGWSEVQNLAGIRRHPKHNKPLADDDLLVEYHKVATELGRLPTWAQFDARASISPEPLRRRFGGLQGTLKRYRMWLEANEPQSPLLDTLETKSKHEITSPPPFEPPKRSESSTKWARGGGIEYGAPIDFRGLRHAPINEQGVVYLFGMVSYELGLIVEAIQASYPDCEAKRCIDLRRNRWQKVRIEFEYASSNFRDHGHDPNQCDLIICWEHNWPECPLEVLELRSVIDRLEG